MEPFGRCAVEGLDREYWVPEHVRAWLRGLGFTLPLEELAGANFDRQKTLRRMADEGVLLPGSGRGSRGRSASATRGCTACASTTRRSRLCSSALRARRPRWLRLKGAGHAETRVETPLAAGEGARPILLSQRLDGDETEGASRAGGRGRAHARAGALGSPPVETLRRAAFSLVGGCSPSQSGRHGRDGTRASSMRAEGGARGELVDRGAGRRPARGELPRGGVRPRRDRAEVRRLPLCAGGGDARVADPLLAGDPDGVPRSAAPWA